MLITILSDCDAAVRVDSTRCFEVSEDIFDRLYDGEKLSDIIRLVACGMAEESQSRREVNLSFVEWMPPGNELITATLKALGGCDDAQNKRPLYCPSLTSLFFSIFPSLRDEYLILAIAMEPTYKIITNFVRELKQLNMSKKQPQILIFNAAGELVAIARSIRSAAELTKVDENEIKLCCENRQNRTEQYYFRYNVEPSIVGDDAFGKLTIGEYDKLCDYK